MGSLHYVLFGEELKKNGVEILFYAACGLEGITRWCDTFGYF